MPYKGTSNSEKKSGRGGMGRPIDNDVDSGRDEIVEISGECPGTGAERGYGRADDHRRMVVPSFRRAHH